MEGEAGPQKYMVAAQGHHSNSSLSLTEGASNPKIPCADQLTRRNYFLLSSGKAYFFFPSQVLNSGGQLQISRPAPEPPRTNGGSNVYQQPHQHVNSNGTYGEYVGQRQSEEEG